MPIHKNGQAIKKLWLHFGMDSTEKAVKSKNAAKK